MSSHPEQHKWRYELRLCIEPMLAGILSKFEMVNTPGVLTLNQNLPAWRMALIVHKALQDLRDCGRIPAALPELFGSRQIKCDNCPCEGEARETNLPDGWSEQKVGQRTFKLCPQCTFNHEDAEGSA